jgi:Trm5-related predicted tRNA methylase
VRPVRGKYAERYAQLTNVVLLDPDVAEVFPDSRAVNRALRALAGIIRERTQKPAA